MEKYLIFEDETSKKFWHIRVESNLATVTFGRIGTAGQTQQKAYPTQADAEKDAAKQAASKLKKGYVESTVPEGTPAAPKAAATTPVKKAEPKTEGGPADVADDGKPKPWYEEDEELDCAFAHLKEERDEPMWDEDDTDKPVKQAAPPAVPDVTDDDIEFDEDDDEDDRREKREQARIAKLSSEELLAEWRDRWRQNLLNRNEEVTDERVEAALRDWLLRSIKDEAKWRHSYRKCEPHIRVLRLITPDPARFKAVMADALSKGVERAIDRSSYLDKKEKEHLKWLLEQGATFAGKEHVVELDIIKKFIAEWKKNPDPASFTSLYQTCKESVVASLAPQYAEGFRETVHNFIAGEYNEGVWPQDATHFVLKKGGVKPYKGNFWKKFDNEVGLKEEEFSAELVHSLPALLQKMAAAGEFDCLKDKGLSIVMVKSDGGEVYLRHVLDQSALDVQKEALETLIADLESRTDFENTEAALKQAVEALLEGVYMPIDLMRARALMQKFLYSCDQKAQEAANDLYCHYDDFYPILQHDRALWCHHNGFYQPAINVMGWAAEKGYAPAAERLAEFKADEKRRAAIMAKYKAGEGNSPKKKQVKIGKDNFRQIFSEADLLLDTDRVLARAYADGRIMIRFRIEGEQAYAETLDWINNLLEKEYTELNDGFQLNVRFLIKPTFINVKGLGGFSHSDCHAFFARAVEYPALREKVKHYAELALRLYDWYLDTSGDEDNCVPGTFAACALAFADEKYVPMIGLFGRNCDDEHSYIQMDVAGPLFKKYGATAEVAAALFDINCSNGQDGDIRLDKSLLTTPACLRGVMEHVASGIANINWEAHHLDYHVPGYVEAIWGDNVKANLKKFKQFADGAATPEDRNTFIDFYNFYKEYACLRDKEDYGEDLTGVAETKKDIVVPVYDTDPILTTAEADKAGWVYQLDSDRAERRAVVFYPSIIDDPELLDFVLDQWKAGSAAYKAGARMSFWNCDGDGAADACGSKWVFHTGHLAQDWGVLLTDGKNKPFVLYGIINVTPLAIRWCKRPFQTAEEAEAARQSHFIRESPQKIKPANDVERALESKLDNMLSAILNEHWWMIAKLSEGFKPEEGRYYDAALLLRAKAAVEREELDKAAAIYDELTIRRPEFAAILARKRSELGKAAK